MFGTEHGIVKALITKNKVNLGFKVISDSQAKLVKAYNVVNQVPESLYMKYRQNYEIDLEKSSGEKHHIIAIPAVFVIDQQGAVRFSYANKNYKVRAQSKDILNNLTEVSKK